MKKFVLFFLLIAFVFFSGCVSCPPANWAGPRPPGCEAGDESIFPDVPESLPSLGEIPLEQAIPAAVAEEKFAYVLPDEFKSEFSKPEFIQKPSLKSDFFIGHTFMDYYSTNYFNSFLGSTLDSMKESGNWIVYDNYFSYYSIEPPKIGEFTQRFSGFFRDATESELKEMIEKAHEKGLKFALMLELNYDVMRGDWQGWEYQEAFWEKSAGRLDELGRELESNSPEINAYWDSWFKEYESFALNHARIAEENNAEMFIIGKQLEGALSKGNEQRWRNLIKKIKEIYKGPVSYAAWTSENFSQAEFFPYEEADYIMIYLYNNASGKENPSIQELKDSFENFNLNQFKPLSEKYGKKVIFLTPFQSRDFGAKQEWFEPSAPSPNVKEDLLIQAKMYEAFLQSIEDEDWVQGMFTWGYWWRNDFDEMFKKGDSSFNKSSTVRNKPANEIIKKWNNSK